MPDNDTKLAEIPSLDSVKVPSLSSLLGGEEREEMSERLEPKIHETPREIKPLEKILSALQERESGKLEVPTLAVAADSLQQWQRQKEYEWTRRMTQQYGVPEELLDTFPSIERLRREVEAHKGDRVDIMPELANVYGWLIADRLTGSLLRGVSEVGIAVVGFEDQLRNAIRYMFTGEKRETMHPRLQGYVEKLSKLAESPAATYTKEKLDEAKSELLKTMSETGVGPTTEAAAYFGQQALDLAVSLKMLQALKMPLGAARTSWAAAAETERASKLLQSAERAWQALKSAAVITAAKSVDPEKLSDVEVALRKIPPYSDMSEEQLRAKAVKLYADAMANRKATQFTIASLYIGTPAVSGAVSANRGVVFGTDVLLNTAISLLKSSESPLGVKLGGQYAEAIEAAGEWARENGRDPNLYRTLAAFGVGLTDVAFAAVTEPHVAGLSKEARAKLVQDAGNRDNPFVRGVKFWNRVDALDAELREIIPDDKARRQVALEQRIKEEIDKAVKEYRLKGLERQIAEQTGTKREMTLDEIVERQVLMSEIERLTKQAEERRAAERPAEKPAEQVEQKQVVTGAPAASEEAVKVAEEPKVEAAELKQPVVEQKVEPSEQPQAQVAPQPETERPQVPEQPAPKVEIAPLPQLEARVEPPPEPEKPKVTEQPVTGAVQPELARVEQPEQKLETPAVAAAPPSEPERTVVQQTEAVVREEPKVEPVKAEKQEVKLEPLPQTEQKMPENEVQTVVPEKKVLAKKRSRLKEPAKQPVVKTEQEPSKTDKESKVVIKSKKRAHVVDTEPVKVREQFRDLTASELYCPRCGTARPVRERLLLVLPRGELYDFRCVVCGTSCGSRELKNPASGMAAARSPTAMPLKPAEEREVVEAVKDVAKRAGGTFERGDSRNGVIGVVRAGSAEIEFRMGTAGGEDERMGGVLLPEGGNRYVVVIDPRYGTVQKVYHEAGHIVRDFLTPYERSIIFKITGYDLNTRDGDEAFARKMQTEEGRRELADKIREAGKLQQGLFIRAVNKVIDGINALFGTRFGHIGTLGEFERLANGLETLSLIGSGAGTEGGVRFQKLGPLEALRKERKALMDYLSTIEDSDKLVSEAQKAVGEISKIAEKAVSEQIKKASDYRKRVVELKAGLRSQRLDIAGAIGRVKEIASTELPVRERRLVSRILTKAEQMAKAARPQTRDKYVAKAIDILEAHAERIAKKDAIARFKKVLGRVKDRMVAERLAPELKEAAKEILEHIDLATPSEKTLDKLMKLLAWVNNDPQAVSLLPIEVQESIGRKLARLKKISVNQLSTEQIEFLTEKLGSVIHAQVDIEQRIKHELGATTENLRQDFAGELYVRFPKLSERLEDVNPAKPLFYKRWRDLPPRFVAGLMGNTVQKLYDMLFRATTVDMPAVVREVYDVLESRNLLHSNYYKLSRFLNKWAKQHELRLDSGQVVRLTGDELAELAAGSEHPDNLRHMLIGGFQLYRGKYKVPIRLSMDDILNIRAIVDGDEKLSALRDALFAVGRVTGKWINKRSMADLGYELAVIEDKYVPMETQSAYTRPVQEASADPVTSPEGWVEFTRATVMGYGHLKHRNPKANAPLVIRGAMLRIAEITNIAAKYYAYATVWRVWNRVLGGTATLPVREQQREVAMETLISEVFGKEGWQALVSIPRNIPEAVYRQTELASRVKRGVLLGNIGVTIVQPVSYIQAMPEMDIRDWLYGFVAHRTPFEEMVKRGANWMIGRMAGFSELNQIDEAGAPPLLTMSAHMFMPWRMSSLQKTDEIAIGKIWRAIVHETLRETNLKPESKEFWDRVVSRFYEIIDRTQPVYEPILRPQNQREAAMNIGKAREGVMGSIEIGTEIMTKIFGFRSQRDRNYGLKVEALHKFGEALREIRAGNPNAASAAFDALKRLIVYYVGSATLIGLIRLGYGGLIGVTQRNMRKLEKLIMETWGVSEEEARALSFIGLLGASVMSANLSDSPEFLAYAGSALLSGMAMEDTVTSLLNDWGEGVARGVNVVKKALRGKYKSEEELWSDVFTVAERMATPILRARGYGVGNILRQSRGFYRTFVEEEKEAKSWETDIYKANKAKMPRYMK